MDGRRSRAAWWLAAVMTAAAACGGAKPDRHPAAEPAPNDDAMWKRFHKVYVSRAARGGIDLLFLGDSITFHWHSQPAWKEFFAPLRADNFAIGGDRTQQVLWRIQHGELEGISPRLIVLLIGTNNLATSSAAETALGVRAIVEEIIRQQPTTRILLLGIFPRSPNPTDPIRAKVAEANRLIAKLDDGGKRVRFLDIGKEFVEPDGTISQEIMPDYLHLSPEGYERWARAILPVVRQLMKRDAAPAAGP